MTILYVFDDGTTKQTEVFDTDDERHADFVIDINDGKIIKNRHGARCGLTVRDIFANVTELFELKKFPKDPQRQMLYLADCADEFTREILALTREGGMDNDQPATRRRAANEAFDMIWNILATLSHCRISETDLEHAAQWKMGKNRNEA